MALKKLLENGILGNQIEAAHNENVERLIEVPESQEVFKQALEKLLPDPIDQAYDSGSAKALASNFSGWRYHLNYGNEFQIIQFKCRASVANTHIQGYIWSDSFVILARATAFVKKADTDEVLTFVFDQPINTALLNPDTKFWFGYKAFDSTVNVMDGSDNITGATGVHDQTTNAQYTADGAVWTNVSGNPGDRKVWLRLYNTNLKSIDEFVQPVDSKIDLISEQVLKYATLATSIAATDLGGQERGTPFTGWGADHSKSGVSFNTVRLFNLKRADTAIETDKWAYVQCYVKNAHSDTTPIAISPKVKIEKDKLAIEEVILPLMNLSLDAHVTLDDTSFSGANYFIGYLFFASDQSSRAFGGNTTGTVSNFAGNSYYAASSDHATWANFSGNPQVPIEHLLLTNPELETLPVGTTALGNRIDAMQRIRVILPDEYQLVVGDTFQMFLRGVVEHPNPNQSLHIEIEAPKGNQFPRYYELTPAALDVGTSTLKVNVYDAHRTLLGSDETTINVKDAVQQPATQINVLCKGDSLTAAGIWPVEFHRRLTGTGGTPVANGFGNINFIGTDGVAPAQYVGRGGKNWDFFNSNHADNPFWDPTAGKVDYAKFCADNGFSGINVMYVMLTWNELGPNLYEPRLLESIRTQVEIDLSNIANDYPNCDVKLMGIPLCSPHGGMGKDYPANSPYSTYYIMARTVFGLNLLYQEIANSSPYSSYVEYVNVSGQVDSDYAFPEAQVPVNTRVSTTERRQTNGLHLTNDAYNLIADAAYRNFVINYCQ